MAKNNQIVAVAAVAIIAVAAMAVYFTGMSPLSTTTTGSDGTKTSTITLAPSACDPQATVRPELRIAIQNKENPNTEYIPVTTYVYEGAFSKDNLPTNDAYVGTFSTTTAGLPAKGSGYAVDCGKTYTVVVPASSGGAAASVPGRTSSIFTMKSEKNDNVKIEKVSNQTYLIARVYDDDARGYLYSGDDASAGTWHASGTNFTSTTGNTTGDNGGLTLGVDGYYRYTISLETNATETTSARFNDQEITVALDRQSSTEWDAPTGISFDGVDLVGNKYSPPSKIANLNYDDAYLIPNNPAIKSSVKELKIEQHALSGSGITDDIKVGVFTAGYYISSKDTSVKYGYANDNPAASILYANYFNTTLVFD